jgi:penicillin-binding protein 2
MLKFLLFKKNRKKRIKLHDIEIEPQEVFLDSLVQKREKELKEPERKFEVLLSGRTLKIFFLFIFVFVFVFFVKTFQMQIIENKKYLALSQENKFVSRFIQAVRGVIYDSKGRQLVFNRQSFDLILEKEKLPQSDRKRIEVLKEISEIIGRDLKTLINEIKVKKENKIVLLENIDHSTLILLEAKINKLPGFAIRQNAVRYYKEGHLFAHIIGYTGRISSAELKRDREFYADNDYVGRDGLEKTYERFLRKNPGKFQIEKDAQGNPVSKRIVSLPKSGKSLTLWLDADLQEKANEALKKALQKSGAKKGVVVALDPNTGGVLALVNIPSFDNNLFNKGADKEALKNLLMDSQKQQPFLNRAISGLYPTGSTIKPLIASAALQEKIISPFKKINCKGKIVIPNKYNPAKSTIKRDWAVHGWTDMRKAIAESCDVYFYTIGGGYKDQIGLGPSKIKKYLKLFGWADKTGIDLPGESKGLIPSPLWKKKIKKNRWWDGDTYNLAIGQGDVLITPIQVAASFVAIANGGTLYQPEVVKSIIDSDKNLIQEIKPKITRKNFIDPENLQIVREGMRQAVTGEHSPHASSVLLNSLPVVAAAKTGTAETARPGYFHNWVTVFAPYEDPRIVLTVMVENVKGIKSVALPAAKEILEWYFDKSKTQN